MKMKDFRKVADLVTSETWDRLKNYGRPAKVGGVETPKDLYGLTFGQLVQAQDIVAKDDINGLCELLLHINSREIDDAGAGEVMTFVYWAAKELSKIGDMFGRLKTEPSAEQKKAGIEDLNFGIFGVLDWYCLRMGITRHDEAEDTPWIRVYECMRIENERIKFEKKLRKIYEQQSKQKHAGKR